jgi:hypothetical protein
LNERRARVEEKPEKFPVFVHEEQRMKFPVFCILSLVLFVLG